MFETIKQRLQARTEKNAIRSTLTWHKTKKRNGEIISDKEITETVYLKRSRIPLVGDWARIYPPVNEDGTWNIPNLIFGGKKNLLKLLIALGIVTIIFLGFKEIFTQYSELRTFCEPFLNLRV